MPGSGGDASFRYEIDNSHYGSTGVIRLRSTGKVGNETRSVIADLKQNGFNDYVYYTNFEVQDPTISGEPANCGNYQLAPARQLRQNIQFAPGDIMRGKVHSNDRILVCGSDFKGAVTTASHTTPLYADQWRMQRRHLGGRQAGQDSVDRHAANEPARCRWRPATTCRPRCRIPAASTPARRASR